jgi:vancomycin resistance protein VanJ
MLRGLRREFLHPRALHRYSSRLLVLYALALLATWVALVTLSERWLPATLLAYGPRAVVLAPAVVLVPFGVAFARRSLLIALGTMVVAAYGILGVRWSPATPASPPSLVSPETIRVLTINAQGGRVVAPRVGALLAQAPSVLLVQECGAQLAEELRLRGGYHVRQDQSLCIASRWPIADVDSMPRRLFESVGRLGYGGSAMVYRYLIARPNQPFQLINLHLATARDGLARLLGSEGLLPNGLTLPETLPFSEGREAVNINARIRWSESERASAWALRGIGPMPLLIAGDFNIPVESTIYRKFWRRFANAFEQRGTGLGFTKFEGRLLRIRIDHVLSRGCTFSGAWVLDDIGSDHRPVVADAYC